MQICPAPYLPGSPDLACDANRGGRHFAPSPSSESAFPRHRESPRHGRLPRVVTITGENLAAALERLSQLRRREILSEEEFAARKQEILFSLADGVLVEGPEDFLSPLIPLLEDGTLCEDAILVLKEFSLATARPSNPATDPHSAPAGNTPSSIEPRSEPSTKRCPSCGKDVSPAANFCPHCLNPTRGFSPQQVVAFPTPASSPRPVREEWTPAKIVAGIVFLVIVLAFVLCVTDTDKKHELTSSGIGNAPPVPHLKAIVRFTGTQFIVTNTDNFDWTDCTLEVNPGMVSSGFELHATRIGGGETYTVGALQFAKPDGTRLNPFTVKPQSVGIACGTPAGRTTFFGGW